MKSLKLRTKKWIRAWTRLELVFHQLQACLCEKKKAKRSWSLLESAGLLDKDKMRMNSYLLTRSPYY